MTRSFLIQGLSSRRFNFQWELGDGNTSTESSFKHFYPDLGSYPVQLILTDLCLNTVDTLTKDLKITLRQAVDATPDIEVCEDDNILFSATDVSEATYKWTGPNNFISEEQFPVIEFSKPNQSGGYAVVGTVSGCSTFPAITSVLIHPSPQPNLGLDTIICTEYRNDVNILEPGQFEEYLWQDGSRASSFPVQQEGSYNVIVVDEFGCQGNDEVYLREQCPTEIYIPNAFSPNYDGYNDFFGPYGHDIISMHMKVYNRWGALLFETRSLDTHWDGTHRGKEVEVGLYIWVMEVEGYRSDGTVYKETLSGTVALLGRR